MPDPRQDDMPTTTVGWEDDEFDVRISYSVFEGDMGNYDTLISSTRQIEAEITNEDDDSFEVNLKVTDNTNRGVFALGGVATNHPGGEHAEYESTETFDKSDIPYYQDDFPNVQSHIPKGERIVPVIKEWSDSQPFQA
ncbi:hypothetical protein [Salinilacihabitans rarus]|uniref:hypothetical protein n=1 Tax=Salinilacihabitans rarus TaxID=2961596 RepID=UPI0020C84B98|nr:hypothetical protein [Salinilacihabitans rarus]